MRIASFSVLIPEGREHGSGHVELPHGRQYTVRLGNHDHGRRCDAEVTIDGKCVGVFRLGVGETMTLERPADDDGRFTFYRADTAEAAQAGAASVGSADRGLVQVRFRPERPRQYTPPATGVVRPMGMGGGICRSAGFGPRGQSVIGGTTEPDYAPPQNAAGVTGLSGQSSQRFVTVANLDYDPVGEAVITLRLVAGEAGPRELKAVAPRANAVPAPAGG
jgi:hypothetical protein